MARTRYFYDLGPGPEPVQLKGLWPMANAEFAQRFPGVGGLLPVTRRIDYKAQPSLHEGNAKCLNGKATGSCECRCSGRNHGRGLFTGQIPSLAARPAPAETAAADRERPWRGAPQRPARPFQSAR